MVVDLWVRTGWSIQSSNPDLEPNDKLPITERISNITQENPKNGWISHKKLSEFDIVIPRTQEEFFCALSVKSGILGCFLSYNSLILRNLSDAIEMIQHKMNKLKILATAEAQVYTKILYNIHKQLNDWVQECIIYPNDLDAIYWLVIDFRGIISNIKNMDFHIGPLPLILRIFNATDTKTPK